MPSVACSSFHNCVPGEMENVKQHTHQEIVKQSLNKNWIIKHKQKEIKDIGR